MFLSDDEQEQIKESRQSLKKPRGSICPSVASRNNLEDLNEDSYQGDNLSQPSQNPIEFQWSKEFMKRTAEEQIPAKSERGPQMTQQQQNTQSNVHMQSPSHLSNYMSHVPSNASQRVIDRRLQKVQESKNE